MVGAGLVGLVLGVLALASRRSSSSSSSPASDDPDPLARWAGPVRAEVDLGPSLAAQTYDRSAQYEYAPTGPYAGVKPPQGGAYAPPASQAAYDREAQYQYDATGPYAGVKPPTGEPQAFDPQSGEPLEQGDGGKPPGADAQYQYDPQSDPRARAARALAVHLSTVPRARWDRSAIREWQRALGVAVDGRIGPETRGAMAQFGQYVGADKHE